MGKQINVRLAARMSNRKDDSRMTSTCRRRRCINVNMHIGLRSVPSSLDQLLRRCAPILQRKLNVFLKTHSRRCGVFDLGWLKSNLLNKAFTYNRGFRCNARKNCPAVNCDWFWKGCWHSFSYFHEHIDSSSLSCDKFSQIIWSQTTYIVLVSRLYTILKKYILVVIPSLPYLLQTLTNLWNFDWNVRSIIDELREPK